MLFSHKKLKTRKLFNILVAIISRTVALKVVTVFFIIFAAEELRAEHPCGNLYAGPRQLSEIETLALTHYLHQQKNPIHTFIAFKEGEVLVSILH